MGPRPRFPGAAAFLPPSADLDALRRAAQECEGCELHRDATQTVFGEGGEHARVMLVGEQPGDHEDREGHPFVGPAGRLLDASLAEAGIDRAGVYVTNAVKHFKWEPRGKRRIHKTPSAAEVEACRPWLEAEMGAVAPEVVVALGATAARSLLGSGFRLTQERGRLIRRPGAPALLATVHPSSILRAPDEAARQLARAAFLDDLGQVARFLRG